MTATEIPPFPAGTCDRIELVNLVSGGNGGIEAAREPRTNLAAL
jgi:hypothetical protein